jgi:hypothetical protein
MTKTSTKTFYEVRITFGVSKELISDENWDKDELNIVVDKLMETADAYFIDKGIDTGDFSTSAQKLEEEPQMDWFHK